MNDVLEELVETRRVLITASREVRSWMDCEGLLGNLVQASQAPSWRTYEVAEVYWKAAIERLDAAITRGEL